jgi:hypothetical protein
LRDFNVSGGFDCPFAKKKSKRNFFYIFFPFFSSCPYQQDKQKKMSVRLPSADELEQLEDIGIYIFVYL